MTPQWLPSGCPKKFKLLKYNEHIIHHFKARDLEIPLIREIFKFRENTSKTNFAEIFLSVYTIAKLKYFAKVTTYSKSPDYVLESYI